MRNLLRRWRNRRFAADLEEELEFHRSRVEEDTGDPGAAQRLMGNQTLMREEARAVWIAPWLETVWQDLRYAMRSLRQAPGFTIAATGALALAIGINTSFFTVFNAIAVRPWPVANPQNVVTVFSTPPSGHPGGLPLPEVRHFREHARGLQGVIAYKATAVRFGSEGAGKVRQAQYVTADFFSVLGVGMSAGRGFRSDEDRTEAPAAVAVFGFEFWRSQFGADPSIIGRTVRLEEVPFVVVGVAAEEFTGVTAGRVDVYLPFSAMRLLPREKTQALPFLTSAGNCCSSVAARLRSGVHRDQAKAELEVLSRQFREAHGLYVHRIELGGTQLFFTPGAKTEMRVGFGLLFLGVTLLLLLACANVGNLCLARSAARSREFAVRGSLGAGRLRLVRQMLTEGLVVAAVALAPAIAMAYWLPRALILMMTNDLPALHLSPDLTVLFYAAGIGIASTLLFALTPAIASTRDLQTSLRSGGTGSGSRFRVRMILLGAQTAMSVILLVAAGLMTRGVQRVANVDPGFAVDEVSAIEMDLPAEMYAQEKVKLLAAALKGEVSLLPDTALALNSPLSNVRHFTGFRIPGRTGEHSIERAQLHEASAAYFDVLRIPLVAGRGFTAADAATGGIIINESMARKYWPNERAVGKAIVTGTRHEIVGVVKDAQTTSLGQVEPSYYRAISGDFVPTVLVRDRTDVIGKAKAAVQRVEPRAELRVVPLRQQFERQLRPAQIGAAIAGALSAFGLLLASMGVFGVCAFVVQQRRREIGVRVALGAKPADVVGFVLGANGRAIGIGLVAGAAGALVVSHLLGSNLHGLSPMDPITYVAVLLLLAFAGGVATIVPAWRAVRMDPVTALRCD